MFTFKFIRTLVLYIKYVFIIKDVIKNDKFIQKISTIFGVQFYTDWIYRIYAIINPAIRDGKYDYESVLEYNAQGDPQISSDHIEKWIMQRMNIFKNFLDQKDLLDIFDFDIQKVSEGSDYLFILMPYPYHNLKKYFKRSLVEMFILIIILICAMIIF